MKTKLYFLLLLSFLFFPLFLKAQLVRVKGKKYLEFSSGLSRFGHNHNLQLGYYFFNKLNAKTGVQYERLSLDYSNVNRYNIKTDVLYNIYQYSGSLFFDIKGSFFLGVENSKHQLFEDYSSFIIGESIGLKTEYLFFPNLSLIFISEQKFIQISKITTKTWSVGVGVNYHF